MRITYFYAKNMAGITVGTRKDEIEIDFSKNKNSFIILNGENGSGKTALLSILHPLRGTNDNRSPVFDKTNATKEIHLEHNGDKYEIVHTWKPNKSFISKNGEQLNDNGNIKSFNEIVKSELGIDEDYFKIGRLGSNVVNFMGLKSTARKDYISEYLPSIDKFLQAYEVVKNKYNVMNKELNTISKDLGRFPEKESLTRIIDSYNNRLNELEESLLKVNNNLAIWNHDIKNFINKVEDIIENTDIEMKPVDLIFNEVKDTVEEIDEELEIIKNDITTLYNKYPSLKERYDNNSKELQSDIKKYEETITDYKIKLSAIDSEINSLLSNIQNINNRIINIKGKVNNEVADNNINEYLKDIKISKNKITSLKKKIEKSNVGDISYISIDNFIELKTNIHDFTESIIENIFQEDYSLLENDWYTDEQLETIEKLEIDIKTYEEKLEDIKNEIFFLTNNTSLLDALKKRPSNCNINDCSFIKNSLEFKERYSKLNKLQKEKDILEDNLKECNETYEQLVFIINFQKKTVKKYYDWYNKIVTMFDSKLLGKPFSNIETFYKDIIQSGVSHVKDNMAHIDEIYEVLKINNDIENETKNLEYLKERKDSLVKEQAHLDEYTKELHDEKENLKESQNRLQELEESKTEINNKIKSTTSKIKVLTYLSEQYESIKDFKETLKEYKGIYKSINKLIEDYNNLDEKINKYESKKNSIELEIERVKEDIQKNTKDVNYIDILLDKKENLDKFFIITKRVRDSLNPKEGIPLLYIKDFLTTIKDNTNTLLELAYGNNFSIDFDLTDKDFFINVYKNFSMLEDISQASQGEISMTTLSLSLAMIKSMIEKYNILYLDEIDGTLSTDNKRIFLTMLEKQLTDLGIEQVFIITHNNEFYSYPVDMILFRGYDADISDKEFMRNKNIIENLS